MLALLIIFFVLVLLVTLLLWAPLALEIDSRHSIYQVSWWYLFRAKALPVNDDLIIDGQILFFRKQWSVLEILAKRRVQKEKADKINAQKKKRGRFSWRMVKALLGSFKVERLDVSLDTGDVIWNAWLFPLAETLHHALRVRQSGFRINFTGQNYIDLKVTNCAGRMAWALTANK